MLTNVQLIQLINSLADDNVWSGASQDLLDTRALAKSAMLAFERTVQWFPIGEVTPEDREATEAKLNAFRSELSA